jgi:peptidoglycan/LPS O-acetylase OafA/YrhL
MGYVPLWLRTGWLGVQLFFVLSGFLVAGLLFNEYRETGRLELRRFYLRRGLKIYPLFALLVLVSLGMLLLRGSPISGRTLAAELLFLQNYLPPLWAHEWSLAVEEHFYLLLPLGLALMCRRSDAGLNPFSSLPRWVMLLGLGVLTLRMLTASSHSFDREMDLYPTHLRIDALAFGVLLAYYHHFRGAELAKFVRGYLAWIAAATALLLLPFAAYDLEASFVRTVGLTGAYLGLGGVVLLAVYARPELPTAETTWGQAPGVILAWIGRCSYGIYLWHLPVRDWLIAKLAAIGWLTHGTGSEFLAFLGLSLLVGSAMTYAVELPILRWRDRVMPGRGRSLAAAVPSLDCAAGRGAAASPAH